MNVLFVCTRNRARSVAAERLCRKVRSLAVRSAGVSPLAARVVQADDLAWADRVYVFEPAHETALRAAFAGDLPPIVDLGIPDRYAVDDPELIALLRESLDELLPRSR